MKKFHFQISLRPDSLNHTESYVDRVKVIVMYQSIAREIMETWVVDSWADHAWTRQSVIAYSTELSMPVIL